MLWAMGFFSSMPVLILMVMGTPPSSGVMSCTMPDNLFIRVIRADPMPGRQHRQDKSPVREGGRHDTWGSASVAIINHTFLTDEVNGAPHIQIHKVHFGLKLQQLSNTPHLVRMTPRDLSSPSHPKKTRLASDMASQNWALLK